MVKSALSRTPQGADEPFEAQAVQVMQGLREAFLGVIEGLPQGAARATDLEKALGVSRTLGWQIHKLTTADDPLEAGLRMPGQAAMEQVLRAARSAGVSAERVRRASAAVEAFESLVERHAGDREVFDTMIGSLAGSNTEMIDLKTRRQAFRMQSRVWGVQVKTYLSCSVLFPGKNSDLMDLAVICGMRDVRRLRPGISLPVMGQRITDSHGNHLKPSLEPEEPLSENGGPILLREYCSQPLPELDTRIEDGAMTTLLRDAPLGNAGVRTVYLAGVSRGLRWNLKSDTPNHYIGFVRISKPMEVLVQDILIHRTMFGTLTPRAKVYGSLDKLGEIDPYAFRDDETLPMEAVLRHCGAGPGVLATPHVPRYREMVESVLGKIGYEPEEFDLYRCTMSYPLLTTMIQGYFDLPETGGW